jgi:hypothetical protein
MLRFFRIAASVLIPLLVGVAVVAAGTELVGTYRVEQVTDLGPHVRVTLHIRLINNSPQELSISRIALRDMHQRGKAAETSAWARLQPREIATVEQEFVISRAEYERWSKGARPMLQVALQPEGGREVMRTIALEPSRARRAQ